MTDKEKYELMNAAVKPITRMLQKRMNNRIEALNTFEPNAMVSIPDEVKKMRELEASRLRAVIEEQKDLIEILNSMYPDA